MLSSYRALLARDGARALALACALGWISMCGYGPAIILAAHAATGSFAVAGVVLAAFSVGSGSVAPLRGRAIDRHGPRVLARIAIAHLVAGGALAVACALHAGPGVLIAAALALGAVAPPIIATARTLWTTVAGDGGARSAHALNAMLADIGVISGPSLAGALAVLASPALGAGVLIAGASGAAGLVARVAPAGPPRNHPRADDAGQGWRRPARRAGVPDPGGVWGVLGSSAGLRTLVATDLAIGACLAGLEVAVIAIAAAGGTAALGVLPIAASALGSIAMTAWVGSRRKAHRPDARFCAGLLLVALVLPSALISATVPALAAVLILVGAGFGLVNAALFELLDGVIAAGKATEAFTWLTTSNAAGSALGAAVSGRLAQRHPTAALLTVTACAALAALTALSRRQTLRSSASGQPNGGGADREVNAGRPA